MKGGLVKIYGDESRSFNITQQDMEKVRAHPQDKNCLLVEAGEIIRIGGKQDGELVEDGLLENNQTVLIKPAAQLIPKRYHTLVSWSAALGKEAARVEPISTMVRPGEEDGIALKVTTRKKLDLNDFPYIFELYLID